MRTDIPQKLYAQATRKPTKNGMKGGIAGHRRKLRAKSQAQSLPAP